MEHNLKLNAIQILKQKKDKDLDEKINILKQKISKFHGKKPKIIIHENGDKELKFL